MIILGLTGSIGMGKSTTADMFRAENIPVYDADKTVHQLYQNEAVLPLQRLFPSSVVNGVVDRQALGRIVLNDVGKMQQLENLIHPMVREKELEFLRKSESGDAALVVLDIPLLFETDGGERVDAILVVSASPQEQKKRVLSRKDMDEKKFAAILAQQMPDNEKRQKADFVIDTEQGMENARNRVREIIIQLQSTQNGKSGGTNQVTTDA
jgi:dephospho-CoA kinase